MASELTWQSNSPEKLLRECFHISTGFHPGQRDSSNFPLIRLSERMLRAATHFLEEDFLPRMTSEGDKERDVITPGSTLTFRRLW